MGCVRFGAYQADLKTRELRKHGLRIKLPDQPFQLLSELLERPGEVVTREELQGKLWPSDTFVDFDRGLNKAMNRLRDALGDTASEPRYIETLPKRGYRFIGEIEFADVPEPPSLEAKTAGRWKVVFGFAGILIAVAVAAVWMIYRPRPSETPGSFRSSLLPPSQWAFLPRSFALSPDGTRLAFVAIAPDGKSELWLRTLSASAMRRFEDTGGAFYPFWSPDGRHVGFFAEGKLKTVDVSSGEIKVLAEAENTSGGTWNRDGVIVFSAGIGQPLYRISAAGGQPAPVTHVVQGGTAQTSSWPWFLPDGNRFLYSVQWTTPGEGGTGLYAGSLDSKQDVSISPEISGNVAFARGHLLFVRGGVLLAQPFDPVRLQTSGAPAAVTEKEIETDTIYLQSGFSLSESGALVFESAPDFSSHLTWFDASGKELGEIPQTGYRTPALSPNGRQVAVVCDETHSGKHSICVYDLERGVSTTITDGTHDDTPLWSRDGRQVTYESRERDAAYLKSVPIDRSGPPRVLLEGGRLGARGWLADGRLLFSKVEGGAPRLYLASRKDHTYLWEGAEAQLSPDGKWIAQASTSGTFAASVSEPRVRVQIANGGTQPRWSRDGRRLFYMSPDRKMMAVSFDSRSGRSGPPRALFPTRIIGTRIIGLQYDVAPDGRFLINSLPSSSSPLTLITGALPHW